MPINQKGGLRQADVFLRFWISWPQSQEVLAETGFPWSVPGSIPQRGGGVRMWVNGMGTPAGAGTGMVGPGVGPGEVV